MSIKIPLQRYMIADESGRRHAEYRPWPAPMNWVESPEVAKLEAAYAALSDSYEREMADFGEVLAVKNARIAELEAERDGLREKVLKLDNKLYVGCIPRWRCEHEE